MLIKVSKTTKAASCKLGINTKEYLQGQSYEIFDSLTKVFIENAWGIEVQSEEKSIEKAPENKAIFNLNIKEPEIEELKVKNLEIKIPNKKKKFKNK